jgi:hypothetical protein
MSCRTMFDILIKDRIFRFFEATRSLDVFDIGKTTPSIIYYDNNKHDAISNSYTRVKADNIVIIESDSIKYNSNFSDTNISKLTNLDFKLSQSAKYYLEWLYNSEITTKEEKEYIITKLVACEL